MIGKGEVLGLGAGSILFTNPDGTTSSGTVSPKPVSFDATHGGDVMPIKDQNGLTVGYIANDESIEVTFDVVPEGTTFANALTSAGIPKLLAKAVITGLKIVAIGPFSDGLNVGGAGILANPWIYLGGAKLNGSADKPWGYSITLKRSPNISANTAIV
jgi:hypothetical protein